MIEVKEREGRAEFRVKVSPGASRMKVMGEYGGALKVLVNVAPERGKANKALEAFLGRELGCGKGGVRVVSGPASRDKRVAVTGMGAREVGEGLRRICEGK